MITKHLIFGSICLFATLVVLPSRADDRAECLSAAEHAQWLKPEGKLVEARQELLACSREQCPGLVRRDCTKWLSEVDALLPTLVITAHDADKKNVPDLETFVDGRPLAAPQNGEPLRMNPGKYTLHFESNGRAVDREIVLHDGDVNKSIDVIFPAASPAKAPLATKDDPNFAQGRRPVPIAAIAFGALGVAALGGSLFFELESLHDDSVLHSTCMPNCSPDAATHVREKVYAADVLLGVGVVSLGVATWFYVTRPTRDDQPRAATALSLPRVDFAPTRGGGFIQMEKNF